MHAIVGADAIRRIGGQQLLCQLRVGRARVDVGRPARAKVLKHHLFGGVPAAERAILGHPGVGRGKLAAAARVRCVGLHGERRCGNTICGGRGAQGCQVLFRSNAQLVQFLQIQLVLNASRRHGRPGRRVKVEAIQGALHKRVPCSGVGDILLRCKEGLELVAAHHVCRVCFLQDVGDGSMRGGHSIVGLRGNRSHDVEAHPQRVGGDAAILNHLFEEVLLRRCFHQQHYALRMKLLTFDRFAGGHGVVCTLVVAVEELHGGVRVGSDAVGGRVLVAKLAIQHLGVVLARVGLQPSAFEERRVRKVVDAVQHLGSERNPAGVVDKGFGRLDGR